MVETTTVPDTIEHSIDIDAPAERVWELVSEPGWYVNEGSVRPHRFEHLDDDRVVVHDEQLGAFEILTVHLDRPRYAAFRWGGGSEDTTQGTGEPATTLVEFWIVEGLGGGVTLRVVESGFATLGPDAVARRRAYEANTEGWHEELDAARRHLEDR